MFGRDEKVSPMRLTAVQYIVLGIFLILAYGLWRLQVVQSDFYATLAEKNRIRNVPFSPPAAEFSIAKAAPSSTITRHSPRCCCAIRPATSTPTPI